MVVWVLGHPWILDPTVHVWVHFYTYGLNLHPTRREPDSGAGFVFYPRVHLKSKKTQNPTPLKKLKT
jgi:hypothetical protein